MKLCFKKYFSIMTIILFLAAAFLLFTSQTSPRVQTAAGSVPFSKGVNFSRAFEAFNVQEINVGLYDEQDFINVKSLGADVIRLYLGLHHLTLGAPDYRIDPIVLRFLDTYVDWAEKYQIYIILDNQNWAIWEPGNNPGGGMLVTDSRSIEILRKIWPQMAEHFKNRSQYVIYEIMNEPNNISARDWNRVQGEVLQSIRRIDPNRTIIVGGNEWNSINGLISITPYRDNNLIYTFHFYDPFLFTHQGANWTVPALTSLSGVPFPYDRARMPQIPNDLRRTIEGLLRDYPNDGSVEALTRKIDQAVTWSRRHNVPLYCGEFGAYMGASPNEDRIRFYQIVTEALNQRNISWSMHDYFFEFGLFNTPESRDFNSELNVDLARAIGFTPPPQRQEPLRAGFTIYSDYFHKSIVSTYANPVFNQFDTNAADGDFAIRWANLRREALFQIDFFYNLDLSALAQQGYILEFKARTERPVQFQVFFQNPENASTIPWTMRFNINDRNLIPNGRWQTIRIPLRDMRDEGAWVEATQQWIQGRNQFNWRQIKKLYFQSLEDQLDRTVWIDSIRIVAP